MKDAAVRTRVLVLAAILALAFGGLTGRLAWLMIVKHGELSQLAERQYSRTVVLRAQRGPIVDRRGAALATSTATESLFVQPRSGGDHAPQVLQPDRAHASRSARSWDRAASGIRSA